MDWASIYAHVKALWVVWFLLLFVFIVARAYWPSRKAELERRGRIPFAED